MNKISVSLSKKLEEFIARMISSGVATSKIGVIHEALRRMREKEAIDCILRARKEPYLKGDLRELAKRIK